MSLTATDREEIHRMLLSATRDRDMAERDAHLRAATGIEQMHNIYPLTSQLRHDVKEHMRQLNLPPPEQIVRFLQEHEALGHVLTLAQDEVLALDAQTQKPVAKLPCPGIGKLAFTLLRAWWIPSGD